MKKHFSLDVTNSVTNEMSKNYLTVVHIAIHNDRNNGDKRRSLKYWIKNIKTSTILKAEIKAHSAG